MTTAKEVALELRRIADSLEREPETEIKAPLVYFPQSYSVDAKSHFLNIARLMPRPYEKTYRERELEIGYGTEAIKVYATVDRDRVCTVITPAVPAVYDCEPLLSETELQTL